LRVQILVLKLLHYLLFAFKGRVSSSIRFRLNHFISKILRGFHGGCACRRVLHVVSVATANISLLLVSEQQIAVILTLFFALCFAFLCEDSAVAKKTKQNKTARRLSVAFC
jgi:hypothetical protein